MTKEAARTVRGDDEDELTDESPSRPAGSEADTKVIWKASPAQIVNFWWYVLGVIALGLTVLIWMGAGAVDALAPSQWWIALAWLIVPLLLFAIPSIVTACHQYVLTRERLRLMTGVINRRTEELELYRVRDTTLIEPLWMRIFGLGTIIMVTSDRSHPEMRVEAIRDSRKMLDQIRHQVEEMRAEKRVREVDFE